MAELVYQNRQDRQAIGGSRRGVALQDNRGAAQRTVQLAIAHGPGCGCAGCAGQAISAAPTLQAKVEGGGKDVVQLNCKYCGSSKHINKNCPIGPNGGNPNRGTPVTAGKGERDLRKRKGHGMMTKEQAKRYVPKYK